MTDFIDCLMVAELKRKLREERERRDPSICDRGISTGKRGEEL